MAADDLPAVAPDTLKCVVPLVNSVAQVAQCGEALRQVRMVEIADGPDAPAIASAVRTANAECLLAARVDLTPTVGDRIARLSADDGAAVLLDPVRGKAVAAAARKRAVELFNAEAAVQKYLAVYDRVLAA